MKIDINLKTFVTAFLFILGVYLSYELRSILIAVFVAFIIFSALKPVVDYLEKKKIKRMVAVVLVYLLIAVVIIVLASFLVNESVKQVRLIASEISLKAENIVNFVNQNFPVLNSFIDVEQTVASIEQTFSSSNLQNLTSGQAITNLFENISPVAVQGLSLAAKIIGGLLSIFIVIFLSIYMVSSKKDFYENGLSILPKNQFNYLGNLLDKIRTKLGAWLVGQVTLMFIIGLATYLIIVIPGIFIDGYSLIRFALIIAIIAGILEAVPNIGPLLTLLITIIFAIATGSTVGIVIYIIIMFTLLQQAESLFIVPAIMRRAIDIHPIVGIISVLAGFELGGPVGALLAAPVAGIIQIIVVDYYKKLKENDK
jgi:predicted PurR-regulated permease PerM